MTKFFTTLAFLIFYVSFIMAQTTHTVCESGCDYTTISAAIAAAAANDIISIADLSITESGVTIDKDLILRSEHANGAIIQAHAEENLGPANIFDIPSATTIVVMENLTLRHGRSSIGGAITNSGDLSLLNCTISKNLAVASHAAQGGGIHNTGSLTMTDCTIVGNLSYCYATNTNPHGGGIYNTGSLEMTNCNFLENTTNSFSSHGTAISSSHGGGIYNTGSITMTYCNFSGNNSECFANSVRSRGGGIYNYNSATSTMENCTFSENTSAANSTHTYSSGISHGGGIYNDQSAISTMTNCTFFANSSNANAVYSSVASGGGVYNYSSATLTTTNCTFSENVSTSSLSTATSGGIYNHVSGTLNLKNTIIANNTADSDPNLEGTPTTNTNSICEGCATGTWVSTDDPMIATLANNCGSTETCGITDPSSPAVDAGTITGAPLLDQVGRPRINTVDIGAIEYHGTMPEISGSARPGAGYALDFDGSTQSVEVPHSTSLDLGNTFSFEAWVNPETLPVGVGSIVSLPSTVNGTGVRLGIRNTGKIDFGCNGALILSTEDIPLNKWTHLVGTYDGTDFKLYKNGILIGTVNYNAYTTSSYTEPLFIGVEGEGNVLDNRFFNGLIDEVRIWNVALSETEIRDWMCKKINDEHSNRCDLVSNYRFDSNSGAMLEDVWGANDGTLVNAPTWATSGAAIGDESTYDYSGSTTCVKASHADGSSFLINNFTGTPDGAHVYLVNEAPNTNTNSLTGDLEESRYYGTFIVGGTNPIYEVKYDYENNVNLEGGTDEQHAKFAKRDDNSDTDWVLGSTDFDLDETRNEVNLCSESGNSEYVIGYHSPQIVKRPGSGYALDFDGTNQYVDLPTGIVSTFNDFTFETWFYTDVNTSWVRLMDFGSSSTVNMFITPSHSGTNIPRFAITVGGGGASEQRITAPSALVQNQWYHIAVTLDDASNTGTMYINGVQVAQNTSMTLSPTDLGSTTNNYFGKSQYADPHLNGGMDDIRIWKTALSQSQIQDWMCKKMSSSHPEYCKLASYYRFDENTGTVLKDDVLGNNGTLINAPNYQMSSAPVGDESVADYNAVSTGTSINLSHANGDQMTVNVTSGTADAIQLYRVDEAANVTTPPVGLGKISPSNHWGVKVFGGVSCVYEIVYDYEGHPGTNVVTDLRICKRDDNADTDWETTSATLSEPFNTLTLTGQTGTQFVLGSVASDALPVELSYFDARVDQQFVKLDWRTTTETNNDYFEIERSPLGSNWTTLERVNGKGTTSTESTYTIYDKAPLEGTSYYRLKQVDLDEKFSYSEKRTVAFSSTREDVISIFPNPAKDQLNVSVHTTLASTISINLVDLQGRNVLALDQSLVRGANQIKLSLDGLSPGLYLISIQNGDKVMNSKLLVE